VVVFPKGTGVTPADRLIIAAARVAYPRVGGPRPDRRAVAFPAQRRPPAPDGRQWIADRIANGLRALR
jgi:hypothetical protein